MNYLRNLDAKLKGFPDTTLTVLLILAGIFAWLIAIYGNPTLKAVVLAWVVAP